MKLRRITKPTTLAKAGLVAAFLLTLKMTAFANVTLKTPQIYAVTLFCIAVTLWGIRRLRFPIAEIKKGKLHFRGEIIDPNAVEWIRYCVKGGGGEEVVVKYAGFSPHIIPVLEREEDKRNLRVYNFFKAHFPDIRLENEKELNA